MYIEGMRPRGWRIAVQFSLSLLVVAVASGGAPTQAHAQCDATYQASTAPVVYLCESVDGATIMVTKDLRALDAADVTTYRWLAMALFYQKLEPQTCDPVTMQPNTPCIIN